MPGQSTRKVDGGRIPGPSDIPNGMDIKLIFSHVNGKRVTAHVAGKNTGNVVPSVALANTLFDSISAAWLTNLAPEISTECQFESVSVRDTTSADFPEFLSTNPAVAGTSLLTSLPDDVAAVLTANLNVRGRGAKGRTYLMGWTTQTDALQGQMSDGLFASMNTFGQALFGAIAGAGLTPAVLKPHRQEYTGLTGAVHPERLADVIEVNSYTCRDKHFDTQRRRGL